MQPGAVAPGPEIARMPDVGTSTTQRGFGDIPAARGG